MESQLRDIWVTVLDLLLIFWGLWINGLPLNLACSFDLPSFSGRRSNVFRCFPVLENKTLSFWEAGCGILAMNSSLVSSACCDLVWEPPYASLLPGAPGSFTQSRNSSVYLVTIALLTPSHVCNVNVGFIFLNK